MRLNRTSKWKVMTIWISWELSLFIFEHIDISWASIIHPSQKLRPLEFARAFKFNFELLDILCARIGPLSEKLWQFEFLESFCCSILSISIYYLPNFDIRVKSYDHSNFSSTSVVQFRASRYIMSQIRTSVWKVMTIRISREHPLFNF